MILAIDTSSSSGSVALGDSHGTREEAFRGEDGRERHSTTLFPALEKLGLVDFPLEKIVVGLGPGSFSGIRVALAAAHGLAEPRGVPVVGARSSDSVALQLAHVTRLGVFADARRGEYYVTVYANGVLERPTFLIPRDAVDEHVGKMTLAVSADPLPGVPERCAPRASDLLALPPTALISTGKGELEPIYLREAVA